MSFGVKQTFETTLELSECGSASIRIPENVHLTIATFKNIHLSNPHIVEKVTIESEKFHKPMHMFKKYGGAFSGQTIVKKITQQECQKKFNKTPQNGHELNFYMDVSYSTSCVNFKLIGTSIFFIDNTRIEFDTKSCAWQVKDMFPMDIKVTIEVYDMFKLCQYNFSQVSVVEQLQKKLDNLEKQIALNGQQDVSQHLSKVEERISKLEQLLVRETEHKDSQCDTEDSFSTASSTPTPSMRNDDVSNRVILDEIKSIKALLQRTPDETSW